MKCIKCVQLNIYPLTLSRLQSQEKYPQPSLFLHFLYSISAMCFLCNFWLEIIHSFIFHLNLVLRIVSIHKDSCKRKSQERNNLSFLWKPLSFVCLDYTHTKRERSWWELVFLLYCCCAMKWRQLLIPNHLSTTYNILLFCSLSCHVKSTMYKN